jgi:hypothetical protein
VRENPFTRAFLRTREDNLEPKAKLLEVRHRIREMTAKNAELSMIARWCLPMRNHPQRSRRVG